jgi:branched-chain amino acid transport system permease protein
MFEAYLIHLAILVCIYIVLALSLQLNIGFVGQFNLGHIAFFGIGAYVSALLTLNGFPFWSAILLAGLIAAFFGYLLSIPTRKLKGDYFSLTTLGFSFVFYAVLLNWTELTRGPLGLPGIPKPEILGIIFSNNFEFLILSIIIAIITFVCINKIVKSPFGLVLESIRDEELMTSILGKDTNRAKSIALATSAFFAGIAGSMYAHYITYIDPSSFTLTQLIPVLCIVIIGGLASLRGTIIATIIIILLPEPLRFIGFPSSMIGPMRQILYSLLLLLFLLYKPKGIDGKIELE